jgi:DNA-directed RNA polymerase alpha subunit
MEIEEFKNSLAEIEGKENQFKSLPKKVQKLLSAKIETIPLDKRITNSCIHHEIYFLRDLVKLKKRNFSSMRNIGSKSINEMDEFLNSKGLTWEMNV